MNRLRAIIIALTLAILGVFIPLIGCLYFSKFLAIKEEGKYLREIAGRAIERTKMTFNRASYVLKYLEKQPFKPCSKKHIKLMREFAFNNPSISEIGYFDKGLIQCTSWGKTERKIKYSSQFTILHGVKISSNLKSVIVHSTRMVGLIYYNYYVLIEPSRFADIIVNSDIKIAILNPNRRIIGLLNNPGVELVNFVLNRNPKNTNNQYIEILHESGWTAVVSVPQSRLDKKLQHDERLLFPFGLLVAAFIAYLIFRLLRRRLSLFGELAIAVENREFMVFYQPIINLESSKCVGAEALMRWQRPNGEWISPDIFIPLAEQSGLILQMTDQVIEMIIHDMEAFLVENKNMHIAINLARDDIETGRILKVIEKQLSKTLIQKNQIWLEVTERSFINFLSAQETLIKARELGYIIAIDDFGTGYSSLSSIQILPLNILKIDKSFVEKIGKDTILNNVTAHIIEIAKTLHLEIIAEGIESKIQIEYLIENKVKYGQGWFFSKALPPREFITFSYLTHNRHQCP